MSAHVSACRRTGFETRGSVAMWGTFGYELDPRKLTAEEVAIVKEQIKEYHDTYDLVRRGDLYRLVSPFENKHRAIWEIVSPEKDRAMVTMVTFHCEVCGIVIAKLRGLDPQRYYKNEMTGEILSGAALMNAGLVLSGLSADDGESLTVYFTAVE